MMRNGSWFRQVIRLLLPIQRFQNTSVSDAVEHMREYYPEEKELQYGVLGIELSIFSGTVKKIYPNDPVLADPARSMRNVAGNISKREVRSNKRKGEWSRSSHTQNF